MDNELENLHKTQVNDETYLLTEYIMPCYETDEKQRQFQGSHVINQAIAVYVMCV